MSRSAISCSLNALASLSAGRRIGLLGGSFNPAHEGHLHISRLAIQRLDLDEIWWLVSPQNPLKPKAGMASYADRIAGATALAESEGGRPIRAANIEVQLGTRFTVDTLRALTVRMPNGRFVWLMGADNLAQIPAWRRWVEIFEILPVAVFNRPSYASKALAGKAAQRFAKRRLDERDALLLADKAPPAWIFMHTPLNPVSATQIRAGRDG